MLNNSRINGDEGESKSESFKLFHGAQMSTYKIMCEN